VIRHLEIRGVVVIEHAELTFGPGLTVITGETGSGKSVLMMAFGLLAGGPVDTAIIRPGQQHAVVEGVFAVPDGIWDSFDDDDPALSIRDILEDPQECVITRRIPRDGRARSMVDGVTVPRAAMMNFFNALVRFSGQGEQRTLVSGRAQLHALDRYCGSSAVALAQQLARLRREVRRGDIARARLEADAELRRIRIDTLDEFLRQADMVSPVDGEYARLRTDQARLRHSDRLSQAAHTAAEALAPQDGEFGAREQIGRAERAIRDVLEIDAALTEGHNALMQAQIFIEDAAVFIRGYLDQFAADSGGLERTEARIDEYVRLAQRLGCMPEDVVSRVHEVHEERDALTADASSDIEWSVARGAMCAEIRTLSDSLFALRGDGAQRLAGELEVAMSDLALPDAKVHIEVTSSDDPLGADAAKMIVQLNPGLPAAPLAEIASGGELSRVLLALHGLAAAQDDATWVFDEIDAGIGGITASAVAQRLSQLGVGSQVIAITHLAQVAARADAQIVLRKSVGHEDTTTLIHSADGEERMIELCRMLGAAADDRVAREHIGQLMSARR